MSYPNPTASWPQNLGEGNCTQDSTGACATWVYTGVASTASTPFICPAGYSMNRISNLKFQCLANQPAATNTFISIPKVFASPTSPYVPREYVSSSSTNQYYSASDSANFYNGSSNNGVKQIFKPNEVSACLPAGTALLPGVDPTNICCTGNKSAITVDPNDALKHDAECSLPDFADVSVYTNRYVSSEASELSSNFFDPSTGYIKDPAVAANFACQKHICASGILVQGLLLSKMPITGLENTGAATDKIYRFMEGNAASDDANGLLTLFKQGLKINSHVYCLQKGSSAATSTAGDVIVYQCPQ